MCWHEHFYPKQLNVYIWSVHELPGNQTQDLVVASVMLIVQDGGTRLSWNMRSLYLIKY